MVSDLKTFTNKGRKIAAQKKRFFWANFALWPLPERLAMVLWPPIQDVIGSPLTEQTRTEQNRTEFLEIRNPCGKLLLIKGVK